MQPVEVIAERFELERLAGSGGMGEVYRARDRKTGQTVALKVLWAEGNEYVERFLREAAVLAELSHPGIVGYVDHGITEEGEPYLALEWLEGETLAQRLKRERLSPLETIALGRRVAEALGAAHRRGVVHRDLKPANLMLLGGSVTRVKLLDFGVARLRGTRPLTMTGMVIGTPYYMSPEQARGVREVDARADVFAFGCVLYHCLAGRSPFWASEVYAALVKVVLEEPEPLSKLAEAVPEPLEALISRMLAKDPSARPADGAELAAELRSLESIFAPLEGGTPSQPIPALTARERRVASTLLVRICEAQTLLDKPSPISPTAPTTMMSPPASTGAPGARERELNALAEGHGGRVEPSPDGLVAIHFALGPGAATDQAARAARCALAVRELIAEAPIALVSGSNAESSQGSTRELRARGAELLEIEGGIRIDEISAGLLDLRFDIGSDARGLFLRAERALVEGLRTLLGKPTPFVGRSRELSQIHAALAQCVTEPSARVVVVIGAAGMGKSRLRYELLRKAQEENRELAMWFAQGDPMSAGSPYAMIARAIRSEAGLYGGEPGELQQRRLHARLGRSLEGETLTRVAEFLGEISGIPTASGPSVALLAARSDPLLMGDQVRRAWEDWLDAETREGPIMLVLEDLHWGDLPTIKLVDGSLRSLADRPFFVLGLARPELSERFPKLWAERGLEEIVLHELSRKGAEELVAKVLGERVDAQTAARIIERAGGNAFYLEELIRAAADGRTRDLPETVLAMVEARLEAEGSEARRVLRAASVFGEVFFRNGVEALLGGANATAWLDDRLASLCERELFVRRGEGRLPGEVEYVFRHALVQEAAYATLTEADRALGHRLAGLWLEQAGERDARLLAEHAERSGDEARAASWYRKAAEQALEGNDFRGAIACATRGAEGASGEVLGALKLLEAEAHRWLGEAAPAAARSEEAMQLFATGSAPFLQAAAVGASACLRLGEEQRLGEIAESVRATALQGLSGTAASASALLHVVASLLHAGKRAVAEAILSDFEELAAPIAELDRIVAARLAALRASRALCKGDPEAALRFTEESMECFLATGDLRNAAVARVNAAHARLQLGAYNDAASALRAVLDEAARLELHNVASLAKQNLGPVLLALGARDAAESIEREAARELEAQGNLRQVGRAGVYLSAIAMARGQLGEAEIEARAAAQSFSPSSPLKPFALAMHSRVLVALGRAEEARVAADGAMSLLVTLGGIEEGEGLVRLAYAEALEASGDFETACTAILEARARLEARASRISDASLRASFLEKVPEHAFTLSLARAWHLPD